MFGDDGLIVLPKECVVDVEAYATRAQQVFGMEVNVKKSYWSNNSKNIQGYYNQCGQPIKSWRELLASLIWPQYLKDDFEYCASRAIGCVMAGASANSRVIQACRAVAEFAASRGADVQRGIDKVKKDPRMYRHLQTMGWDKMNFSMSTFTDPNFGIPIENCSKLVQSVNPIYEQSRVMDLYHEYLYEPPDLAL